MGCKKRPGIFVPLLFINYFVLKPQSAAPRANVCVAHTSSVQRVSLDVTAISYQRCVCVLELIKTDECVDVEDLWLLLRCASPHEFPEDIIRCTNTFQMFDDFVFLLWLSALNGLVFSDYVLNLFVSFEELRVNIAGLSLVFDL